MSTSDITARILAYCKEHDIEPTTFGLRAVNDGKLVRRLLAGGSITLRTLERIEAQLATNPQEAEARAAERGAA